MDISLIVSVAGWFVASFITGICGIGAAAIATAMQITVMPVQTVVLVSCLVSLAVGLSMFIRYARYCRWKTACLMFAGTLPGSLFGIFVLRYAHASMLEICVGVMLIFCAGGMALFKNRRLLPESPLASLVVGVIGGTLGTCVNIDGPVVAIYGLQAGWQPMIFLGTTSVYFLFRIMVTCAVQAAAGLYTSVIVDYVIWCVPVALIGMLLSIPVIRRVNSEVFRVVVQIVIALSGLLCLGRAITSFIGAE